MRSVFKAGFSAATVLPGILVLAALMLSGCSEEERAGPTAVVITPQQNVAKPDESPFFHRVVTDQLTIPWQLDFTPDGRILITERNGFVLVVTGGRMTEKLYQ